MGRRLRALSAGATLAVLWSSGAVAQPTPQASLNLCQKTVNVETAKFIKDKATALAACLNTISTEVLRKNAADVHFAALPCVTQFRKLNDSRALGTSIPEKLVSHIIKKCAPGQLNVTHTLNDITGKGVGLPQQANTLNIDRWCERFGGDGSIDNVGEWISCLQASAECSVDAALATQFPRAIEWLDAVKPKMNLLTPPSTDLNRIIDAVNALDTVRLEIAGSPSGTTPNIRCGASQFPASGQMTSYAAGDDGAIKAGAALRYHDNLDGTVTDVNTGLMWEKKAASDFAPDSANLHDVDNCYPWSGVCSGDSVTPCGTDDDCTVPGGTCDTGDCQDASPDGKTIFEWVDELNSVSFAGHSDWRIPNQKELQSLVDFATVGPSVDTAFNATGCSSACTLLTDPTCSCTAVNIYWSSTTVSTDATFAWFVSFFDGSAAGNSKPSNSPVRAVRGGL